MGKYYSETLQKGSKGDATKEWQRFLNTQGYNLTVDGDFGGNTDAATRDYQSKNGLGVDGIVGQKTWGKAGYTLSPSSQRWTYDDFSHANYSASDAVTKAGTALDTHNATKPAAYSSQWQSQLNGVLNKIMKREDFSYDFNSDALYQQYKDKYIQQGKMAMQDAIGQASAMTGGYGNSYAATVGNQAYQSHLQQLNDVIPELYQIAYDRYNQEGQELYNQYGLLTDRENTDYSRYRDSVGDYYTERDYLTGRYDSERDFDYSKYIDARNFEYGKYSDDRNLSYSEHRDAISDEQWDTSMSYQKERDAVSDEQWGKNYNLSERELAMAEDAWELEKKAYGDAAGGSSSGGSSSGGNGTSGSGNTTTASSSIPSYIVTAVKNYTTKQGQADYLAKQVNAGKITEDQAYQILDSHGVTPLTERNWEMVDNGGANWFWGIDNDAAVRDETGKQYTLKELKKELEKTMSSSEAKAYIKKLQGQLGI